MYINISKLARKNKLNVIEATINDTSKSLIAYHGIVICKKYKNFDCLERKSDRIYFHKFKYSSNNMYALAEVKNSVIKKDGVPCYIVPMDNTTMTILKDDYITAKDPLDFCITEEQFLTLELDKVFPDYKNKQSCLIYDNSLLSQVA